MSDLWAQILLSLAVMALIAGWALAMLVMITIVRRAMPTHLQPMPWATRVARSVLIVFMAGIGLYQAGRYGFSPMLQVGFAAIGAAYGLLVDCLWRLVGRRYRRGETPNGDRRS